MFFLNVKKLYQMGAGNWDGGCTFLWFVFVFSLGCCQAQCAGSHVTFPNVLNHLKQIVLLGVVLCCVVCLSKKNKEIVLFVLDVEDTLCPPKVMSRGPELRDGW